jgi:hypothetical protein
VRGRQLTQLRSGGPENCHRTAQSRDAVAARWIDLGIIFPLHNSDVALQDGVTLSTRQPSQSIVSHPVGVEIIRIKAFLVRPT